MRIDGDDVVVDEGDSGFSAGSIGIHPINIRKYQNILFYGRERQSIPLIHASQIHILMEQTPVAPGHVQNMRRGRDGGQQMQANRKPATPEQKNKRQDKMNGCIDPTS